MDCFAHLFGSKNGKIDKPIKKEFLIAKKLLPWFLQSYYSRKQIFARRYHHLLTKDYSEDHDILSKSHKLDLELRTIFFNIDPSKFIDLMLLWETRELPGVALVNCAISKI